MREQEARRPQVPRCVKAVMPLPARPPRMAVSAATGCSSPKHGRIERWCSPARAPPPPPPPPPPRPLAGGNYVCDGLHGFCNGGQYQKW